MKEKDYKISLELRELLSAKQANHFRIVPLNWVENILICVSDREDTQEKKQEREVFLPYTTKIQVVSKAEFSAYYAHNYRLEKQTVSTLLNNTDTLLEQIITTAKQIGSSDIHMERYEKEARIRLRLDGKLKSFFTIPLDKYNTIVNQLKIKANLDISQKRLPQDGRISLSEENIDLRVSSMPTLYAEKIVLRLLGNSTEKISLDQLGFSELQLNQYKKIIQKQQGIILISGPTGSGKTTTLYATLKEINTENINILTIEDPIEYTLKGINQVQINEAIGLNFPNALRSFLRQDPDVIMVGEIRDEKTAQIAIRAALTGHLVLATIHTNSAWGTVARLGDMGIPHFLIAETLQMSLAQRLVRVLCSACKEKTKLVEYPAPIKLDWHYISSGCTHCHFTGYRGRVGLYELIPMDSEFRTLIRNNKSEQIDEYRNSKKIPSLSENALTLIRNGTTSLEEVYQLFNF